jgi:DNA-binding response OmpR family regulator
LVGNKKVLIIDDEVHIRRVIEIMLQKRGYDVITASDGIQGVALIESLHPDVVISDINMPKMDGKTLCKTINVMKEAKSFLTILMTAQITGVDENWLSQMKETVFMEKPFSPIKLADYIDRYFG